MKKFKSTPYTMSSTLNKMDNEYNGRYRGTVLDNEDPDERGRCKVFVHGVYDESLNKDNGKRLPWAEPCQPLFCGGMGGVVKIDEGGCNGTFQCPDIGSTVWVFFESGDITRPVMFGQTTDKNGKFSTEHCRLKWEDMYIDLNRDLKTKENTITIYSQTNIEEYANDNNIRRLAGHDINDTATNMINIDTLNSDINVKSANDINVEAANNINVKAANDINVEAANNINITAGSVINIKAPTVNITGDTTIDGTCHITGATNIDSETTINSKTTISPDAIIGGKSFNGHIHLGDGGPAVGPTSPPIA